MATMVLQYCVFLFLLGLTATYAKYCGTDCCLQKGIDQESCSGSGTSDTTDLACTYLEGNIAAAVFGKPGDIYRVWAASIQLQRGIQSLFKLYGLRAYFFQIPKYSSPNCTEFEYFSLETGKCAKLEKITHKTDGNVADTSLTYKRLLQLVEINLYEFYPAPCRVFGGNFGSCSSDINVALSQGISYGIGGLTSFRNLNFNGNRVTYNNDELSSIMKDQKLSVTFDSTNGMYYQTGYRYGKQFSCKDPYPNRACGKGLREYNYEYVNQRGEACRVANLVGEYASKFPLLQLNFNIVAIFTQSCNNVIIIYSLIGGDSLFPTYRGLFSAAC